MKTKFFRIVPLTSMPLGNFRSLPAEIGTAAPMRPVMESRPLVHPQQMSQTVEVGFPPLEPVNGSTLAEGRPPELLAAPAPTASSGIVGAS